MYLLDKINYYYNAMIKANTLLMYYHYKSIFDELCTEYEAIKGLKA